MIKLGQMVRDTVTGFEGICITRTDYISGCTRIGLQPKVDKEGKIPEAQHFDEPMCVVVQQAILTKPSRNGGPGKSIPPHRAPPR